MTAVRKNQHAIGAEAIEALIGGLKMHGKRRREMIHLHRALVGTFLGGRSRPSRLGRKRQGYLGIAIATTARAKMRVIKVRKGSLAATPIKATSQVLSPESISRRRALAMVDDS